MSARQVLGCNEGRKKERYRMACSDSDYAYLRELVQTQSANVVDASRKTLFESRLQPLVRVSGADNLEGLVGLLREKRSTPLHRAVAEAMTINETSFFRDVKPFDVLRDDVLPQLIEQKSAERRLRIWSAASSTGQEAYSLAMLLAEHFPQLARWDVRIVGTDLSREVIEYAKRGRYRKLEVNRGLPAKLLVKYFRRDEDEWEVHQDLKALCEFEIGNLCSPPVRSFAFDLILLRNVLLYFSQPDRSTVFHEVHRRLSPRGFLVLGNAEQAEDSTELFRAEFSKDCYFYRPIEKR